MSDVERIADAMKHVQRAYYCPPINPYMIQGAAAFAVDAKEARLEHIVSLTQWLASSFPSHPQFASESDVWRREHGSGGVAESCTVHGHTGRSATSRAHATNVPGESL